MKFKKGDKVTLNKNMRWGHNMGVGAVNPYGPKFGEIVTVNHYDPIPCWRGKSWVNFDEYPDPDGETGLPQYYNDQRFEKVVSDEVLREDLATVPEPMTYQIP